MANTIKKRMTEKEKRDWTELYEYVRKNIMKYDENQSLSKNMVLRLKGLCTNKFIANNHIADTANYSYEIILLTFKYCIVDISKGLNNISFKDENHKFNYILKIVESNLNNVYTKIKQSQKSKEITINTDMTIATHLGADYQRKTGETLKDLEDLW